jgi:hypothetical protein
MGNEASATFLLTALTDALCRRNQSTPECLLISPVRADSIRPTDLFNCLQLQEILGILPMIPSDAFRGARVGSSGVIHLILTYSSALHTLVTIEYL